MQVPLTQCVIGPTVRSMELLAMLSGDSSAPDLTTRPTSPPRSSRVPGMGFPHELLLALIMAVAMAATVFLYR
jgi:hypothetical protein